MLIYPQPGQLIYKNISGRQERRQGWLALTVLPGMLGRYQVVAGWQTSLAPILSPRSHITTYRHTEHCSVLSSGSRPSVFVLRDNEEWQQQPGAWCNIQHLLELWASSRGGKYLMGMLWLIFQITGPDINIRGRGDGHKISFMLDWDVLPIKTNLWHFMYFEPHVLREFNDWTAHNFMGYELWARWWVFVFLSPQTRPLAIFFNQLSMETKHLIGFISI